MACACIDVGSNTTRLLVAASVDGRLEPLRQQRAFIRLGRELHRGEAVGEAKVAELAQVVGEQARAARALGVDGLRVVATAAIRRAHNRDELCAALEAAAGVPVWVLSAEEEARLAFMGATRTLVEAPGSEIAVVDVGGGSSEIVVGTLGGGVSWSRSFPVGSGLLTAAHMLSDPPAASELEAARGVVEAELSQTVVPPVAVAVAVGGSATSLRRLGGVTLDRAALARVADLVARAPSVEVAERLELAPARARLLPAGVVVLEAIVERLEVPLRLGAGGLREGVVLELLEGAS